MIEQFHNLKQKYLTPTGKCLWEEQCSCKVCRYSFCTYYDNESSRLCTLHGPLHKCPTDDPIGWTSIASVVESKEVMSPSSVTVMDTSEDDAKRPVTPIYCDFENIPPALKPSTVSVSPANLVHIDIPPLLPIEYSDVAIVPEGWTPTRDGFPYHPSLESLAATATQSSNGESDSDSESMELAIIRHSALSHASEIQELETNLTAAVWAV